MKQEKNKKTPGFALPLALIVLLGVSSFFIQIVFNKPAPKEKCDYATTIFPAEVIHSDTVSPGYCEFLFRVDREQGPDTVTYSSEFGGYASFDQMQKKQIVRGEVFQFAVQKLKKGNCPPLVEVLVLEKYKSR